MKAAASRWTVAGALAMMFCANSWAQAPPRTYATACGPCHDRGGFAVRVLTDRLGAGAALIHQGTAFPPEAIRAAVRRGLGAMPAMSRAEVSDAELDAIVAFLARASARGQTP